MSSYVARLPERIAAGLRQTVSPWVPCRPISSPPHALIGVPNRYPNGTGFATALRGVSFGHCLLGRGRALDAYTPASWMNDRAAPQVEGYKGERRMPVYQITSIKSGVVLDPYEGDDEQGARNAMPHGAGFDDEAQAAEASPAVSRIQSRARLIPLQRRPTPKSGGESQACRRSGRGAPIPPKRPPV
jgi:hypothetical protein